MSEPEVTTEIKMETVVSQAQPEENSIKVNEEEPTVYVFDTDKNVDEVVENGIETQEGKAPIVTGSQHDKDVNESSNVQDKTEDGEGAEAETAQLGSHNHQLQYPLECRRCGWHP